MNELIKDYEKLKEEKRKISTLAMGFDSLGWDRKKEYLKFECDFTCQKCGNNKWMGERIPLEVDHIDGNNSNNVKENLMVLCPNCHALTGNWRGRNKTKKRFRVQNSVLLESLIKTDWNMRQSLIDVGLSPKGGNYKRCHAIKREYEELGSITDIKITRDIPKEEFIEIFDSLPRLEDVRIHFDIGFNKLYDYMNYQKKYLVLKN